ncbi:MAG: hypothetical protein ACREXP_27555, partial [Steroidobacteraceae bacterium]
MAGSFNSMVSRVLKRSLQASHSRRRRIVAPSSETRESITRVSACWQNGQYMERLASEKRHAVVTAASQRYLRRPQRTNRDVDHCSPATRADNPGSG